MNELPCWVSHTTGIINIEGGNVVHGANGYSTDICPGCTVWTLHKIKETRELAADEYTNPPTNNPSNLLEQIIVEVSIDDKPELVIDSCTPIIIE